MIQSPPRTILEVFESLPEGTLAEVINNQLVMPPAPDFWHQDIVTEISSQLRIFLKQNPSGRVVVSPVDVYLNPENVYQPDIVFLTNDQMSMVQKGRVRGAPAMVIEVLSPGTERYDKREKKQVYEQSGVEEYWIVNVETKKVTGYQLLNDKYVDIPSKTGVIVSPLVGITIKF